MDGFDGKHADYETSHERADYGTISQLEVYEVTVHTAMIPPTATTHNSRRWMLNIMEKPMAEIAAAIAYM